MRRLKVLLADDHACFRRILVSFLKSKEEVAMIEEAADGKEVVEKAELFRPDIILMDIHMPFQNGIEATKTIKKILPATRIFILSMDINEYSQKNAHEVADGFISKSSIKYALLSILSGDQDNTVEPMIANAFAV